MRYCHNPFLVMHHFREVSKRRLFVARITGKTDAEVRACLDEIEHDAEFHAWIMAKRQHYLGARPSGTDFMLLVNSWGSQFFQFVIHYALVRLLKPEIVLETGGTPGSSSAFMLRAMQRNGHGRLVTLDLPSLAMMKNIQTPGETIWYANMPTDLPPGWLVPDSLRSRHHQVLGDARETLPETLKEYPELDIFIHDSDHSYEHMLWEYRAAYPHVKPEGLFCSDDVTIHSAFEDFALETSQSFDSYFDFGVIKKPAN